MDKRRRDKISNATPEQFSAWLGTFEPSEPVGDAYEGSGCPLSAFIEDTAGVEVFVDENEVCQDGAEQSHPTRTVPTPDWMTWFILALHVLADRRDGAEHGTVPRRYPCPVSASESARALACATPKLWRQHPG